MSKKKLIIILLIILIIVVIVVGLILYFRKRAKYIYDIEEVTEIEYNIIYIENRYGVIDGEGNVIIEPNYDVIQIPDPSKPLFVCMSNYNTETKEYETKVLNDKKEQIITGYDNVQAIPTETTADEVPFENTVLRYKQDGKYGLIDMEGNEITDAIYDEITAMTYKEGMLLVREGDYVGIININGVEVIISGNMLMFKASWPVTPLMEFIPSIDATPAIFPFPLFVPDSGDNKTSTS